MPGAESHTPHRGFVDFGVEIGLGSDRRYPVRIASPAGNAQVDIRFPFGADELTIQLLRIGTA